jgi:hypothetical protein
LLILLSLPALALAQDDIWDDEDWGDEEQASSWSGFIDAGIGTRFSKDPLLDYRNVLEEWRARVETSWTPGNAEISLKGEVGYDGIINEPISELRELLLSFSPTGKIDARIGRQVQTWGTGDLVFLNDLFPKDFQSFFAGRDDEYLKAPGDAVRLTRYSDSVNVDFSWTPVFEPNRYLTGERFSFYSPLAGGNVAPDPPLSGVKPEKDFGNGEFALRLFKTIDGREYAAYAYRGFFKDPSALNEQLQPTFAPLQALGASLRQPAGTGMLSLEFSYYDSRDNRDGANPLLPRDQLRALLGYEWEAKANFTVGLQYYLEQTLDPGDTRHLLTNRLTYQAAMGKYLWSLFTFYSPSDADFYLRPSFTWRQSDQWSFTAGGNLFGGSDDDTFFNQLQDGSNVYLRARFSY